MKKIYTLMAMVACAMMFVGCQKDSLIFNAQTEDYLGSNNKIYLNDEGYACWHRGDPVRINNVSSNIAINVKDKQAVLAVETDLLTSTADFTAAYPSTNVISCAEGNVKMKYTEEQVYREVDMSQVIDAPMVAYAASKKDMLKFRNVGSVIALTVPNNGTSVMDVTEIAVTSTGSNLWGTATVSVKADPENPTMKMANDGGKTVRLTFPQGNGKIATGTSRTFYIAIPVLTNSRLAFNVCYNTGSSAEKSYFRFASNLAPAEGINVTRSRVLALTLNYAMGEKKTGINVLYGAGTDPDPRQIRTASDLCLLASLESIPSGNYFTQLNDVELPSTFSGIGSALHPFTGVYRGNDKIITNHSASSIFNVLGNNAKINKVKVYNDRTVTTPSHVGGLVDVVKGNNVYIHLCYMKGSINVSGTTAYAVGGICGKNEGADCKIEDCVNDMNITGTSDLSIVGGILGENSGSKAIVKYGVNNGMLKGAKIGGMVGQSNNKVTINRCKNNGELSSTKAPSTYIGGMLGNNTSTTCVDLYNCINHGVIIPTAQYVGGLIGNNSAKVQATNCYSDGKIDDDEAGFTSTAKGGLIGKNSASASLKCVYVGVKQNLNDSMNWIIGEGTVTCTNVYRPVDGGFVNDAPGVMEMPTVEQYNRRDHTQLVAWLNANKPGFCASWVLIDKIARLQLR